MYDTQYMYDTVHHILYHMSCGILCDIVFSNVLSVNITV